MKKEVKGYKVFNPDWKCRDFQFKVGDTFEKNVTPSVCNEGFHFCKNVVDCFNYYTFNPNNKIAEVIALGEVVEDGDKSCTNKIKIVREVSWGDMLALVNSGKGNSGYRNSGDYNSGYYNSGNYNSGNYNSGYRNSGNYNSGKGNTGDYNSGNRNTGYCNTGYCNAGYRNTGNRNTGYCNTGYRNSGDYNTGDYNSGNYNTGGCNTGDYNSGKSNTGYCNAGYRNAGDYNSGNYNTGYCNTGYCNAGDYNLSSHNSGCFNTKRHKLKFFDKETDISMDDWRKSKAFRLLRRVQLTISEWIDMNEMTNEEKKDNPNYKTTFGYLKVRNNAKAFPDWWASLTKEEKDEIKKIPNFNKEKFHKITGIDKEELQA